MNLKELVETFIIFEENNNLFDLKTSGENYWHYIRLEIFNIIANEKFEFGNLDQTGKSKISKIRTYFFNLAKILLKQPLLNLKRKDILIFNHSRRKLIDGYYTCIYTDYILEHLKHSYYVFELPHQFRHLEPIKTQNIKYLELIHLMCSIKILFNKKLIYDADMLEVNQLGREIAHVFNLKPENLNFEKILKDNLLFVIESKKYYRKIIDKIKPKLIIEVNHYQNTIISVNEIAKERGIKTVELQHGTMGKYFIPYNFHKKQNLPGFPEEIWLFGAFWKNYSSFPINNESLKEVGFPYLERMYDKFISSIKPNNKKIILFLSQWNIGNALSSIAVRLNKLINKQEYEIYFKMHPAEENIYKQKYANLIESDITLISSNNKNMYYYFNIASYQVGVYSTALFEGLRYGLKTFIFKTYGHEQMEKIYKNGYAKLFENEIQLFKYLDERHDEIDINYLWKSNSLNGIINEIGKNIAL